MHQHKNPCATCPFTSKSKPGATGGSSVAVYVGQLFLPYQIACHERINYDDPNWKETCNDLPQCVGHAMVRESMGVAELIPDQLLKIRRDPKTGAFRDIYEFWAHHEQISVEAAKALLTLPRIISLTFNEILRDGTKITPLSPRDNAP